MRSAHHPDGRRAQEFGNWRYDAPYHRFRIGSRIWQNHGHDRKPLSPIGIPEDCRHLHPDTCGSRSRTTVDGRHKDRPTSPIGMAPGENPGAFFHSCPFSFARRNSSDTLGFTYSVKHVSWYFPCIPSILTVTSSQRKGRPHSLHRPKMNRNSRVMKTILSS